MVIVCGLGQVGYRICRLLLRLQEPVTVITQNSREDWQEELERAGVKFIVGDARTDQHLLEAGVKSAKAVVVCISDDLTNIEVAFDVRRLNPHVRLVVRLFDQVLASHLHRAVGITRALAMSTVAAPAFVATALGEGREAVFSDGDKTFSVERTEDGHRAVHVNLPAVGRRSSAWVRLGHMLGQGLGLPVSILRTTSPQLRWLAGGMLVLMAASVLVFQQVLHVGPLTALYFVVATVTTTGYGDVTPKDSGPLAIALTCLLMGLGSVLMATLYSILTDYIVRIRLDQILGRQALTTEDHVVLVGLGNVGFRVVQELIACGTAVVVVEKDPENDLRSLLPKSVPVLTGDGRDPDVLGRAGLANASALLAVTEDDVTNLSACLMARSLNPKIRVVTRLFDDRFAGKAEASLPIDAAVSASKIASPVFIGAALYDDCVHAYTTAEEFVVLTRTADGFEAVSRPLLSD